MCRTRGQLGVLRCGERGSRGLVGGVGEWWDREWSLGPQGGFRDPPCSLLEGGATGLMVVEAPRALGPPPVVFLVDMVAHLHCQAWEPAAPPLPLGVEGLIIMASFNLYRFSH